MPVDSVLAPQQMQEMMRLSRTSFTQLSEGTGVSRAQLCEYSRGTGNLRGDQLEKCARVLLKAVRDAALRADRIAELVGGRRDGAREAEQDTAANDKREPTLFDPSPLDTHRDLG